ncbi:YczE/YyaS/YitT family protein [Psychrilyobacter atlanticus]|uniref:YczE/YyaS/YitT family protein n=1 Tax=Psychrilyobacter atlanticus TaxID=271091 RepID=UPI00041AE852|nr:membrane protein [Psychrilyobacter atlanticus]
MKKEMLKYLKLFLGLFICSLGIIVIIKSNLGFSPWDVLHQGISKISDLTIGQASIFVGFIVITLDFFLGERIGSGSILNIIFLGTFMDLILYLDIVPLSNNMFTGIFMMFLGMFILSIGCYLYISPGLGCGPRDALMVALTKKTKFSVGTVRNIIEISVLIAGYLMGGYAGVGTVITALFTGSFIQGVFRLFKFDVKSVVHRDIRSEAILLKRYVVNR